MRSVIIKPLTMFVAARATATETRSVMKSFFGFARTIKPATMETDEMALVIAISGVWSNLDTWRMSSVPRKVARIKIRRFTARSVCAVSTNFTFSLTLTNYNIPRAFFVAS